VIRKLSAIWHHRLMHWSSSIWIGFRFEKHKSVHLY